MSSNKMEIYQPAEDSFLLQESLKNFLNKNKPNKNIKILDMGTGSGIQALTCLDMGFVNITAVDTTIQIDAGALSLVDIEELNNQLENMEETSSTFNTKELAPTKSFL